MMDTFELLIVWSILFITISRFEQAIHAGSDLYIHPIH
jgi:hypothetical protein